MTGKTSQNISGAHACRLEDVEDFAREEAGAHNTQQSTDTKISSLITHCLAMQSGAANAQEKSKDGVNFHNLKQGNREES